MPRGRKKTVNLTIEEQISAIEAQLVETEAKLKELKAKKKELVAKKEEEKVSRLLDVINSSNKNIDEVIQMLSQQGE